MTSMDLTIISCNDRNREKAAGLKAVLQGKSCLDLDVTIAPYQGNLVISVATPHDVEKDELVEMVTMIMADTLMGFAV